MDGESDYRDETAVPGFPTSAAILFSDLGVGAPGYDEALSQWDDPLVSARVLDVQVIGPPSERMTSPMSKPPRRGVLWVEELELPRVPSKAEVIVVGDLQMPPTVDLLAATKEHLHRDCAASLLTIAGETSSPLVKRVETWFLTPEPADLSVHLWKPDALRRALTGDPLPTGEAIAHLQLPPLPDPNAKTQAKRPAIFLDRDGTIIEDADYLCDPAKIRFFPESAAALHRLRNHGYLCVLVSNQSGVGRGMFSERTMWQVHRAFQEQLADRGVTLDGAYYSTAAPTSDDPAALWERKPNPGLLLRAAKEIGIDLEASWMIGDSARDLVAGQRAGCKGCLFIESGKVQTSDDLAVSKTYTGVPNLERAADVILSDHAV